MSLSRLGLFLGVVALGAAVGSAAGCKKDDATTTDGVGDGNGQGGATTTDTGTDTGTTTGTSTATGKGGSGGSGGSNGGSGGAGGATQNPCGECAGGTVCDPGLGCVECVDSAQCKDAAKPVCVQGRCAECGTEFDCGKNEVCSQYDHTCTGACGSDTDCKVGNASHCDPVLHYCGECTATSPCPTQGNEPKTCFQGRCVTCFADVQCGGQTPHCDAWAGACVACLLSSHCADGEVCADHACVKK